MTSIISVTESVCLISGYDHIEIEHDGSLTWAEAQSVKDMIWGKEAIGFEMYPPANKVVNGESADFHYRHIWKWHDLIPWPDISAEG